MYKHERERLDLHIKICPYCGSKVVLKDSKIIYGKSYGMVWICSDFPVCDSYVGTHKKSLKPLGTLANAELRELRKTTHSYFDNLWNRSKAGNGRTKAYEWLSEQLQISPDKCHIGMFDEELCNKTIEICKKLIK